MALPTITPTRHSLAELQATYNFTLSWVQGHPALASYKAGYEAFQGRIDDHLRAENKLQQAISAQVLVAYLIDQDLDDIARRVVKLLPEQTDVGLQELKDNLLGGQSLSRFLRPILSGQLRAMKIWVAPLQGSTHPGLAALGAELAARLPAAVEAEEHLEQARAALERFRSVNERPKLYEDFNALRKAIYQGVGGDLAEEIFEHDTTQAVRLETALKQAEEKVNKLQADLEAEKQRLAALQAKKAERDAEEAERLSRRERLAQLAQQKAEIEKQMKELK